jgi:cytochrome b involved in lipid metabolism
MSNDSTATETTVEITYKEVAEHKTKKDLYMVINDMVYDTTKFVDEHP